MSHLMIEDLFRAFPEGYLPIRGVRTLCGLTMSGASLGSWEGADPPAVACLDLVIERHPPPTGDLGAAMKVALLCGNLLPRVDPADTVTWAACLAHLYQMIEKFPAPSTGLVWWGQPTIAGMCWSLGTVCYDLSGPDPDEGTVLLKTAKFFLVDSGSPAVALVQAIAQQRGNTADEEE